jgi:hypothetical protein
MRRGVASHTRRGRVADKTRHYLGAETTDTCDYALILLNVQFSREHRRSGQSSAGVCARYRWSSLGGVDFDLIAAIKFSFTIGG